MTDRDIKAGKAEFSVLKEKFAEAFSGEDRQPYERYSASIGMAVYSRGNDSCIDDVLKRADSEMYQSKQEFRNRYGKYR